MVIVHHASSEPALDADLDGKDELGGEFIVAGDACLEDDLVAADAVDELRDSGHKGTLLPKKNPGDAGVIDERLDSILNISGTFTSCFCKALISSRDFPSVFFDSR